MAKKKHAAHGGGHGWFVTFADLMGLLMAFFVVLTAFSTQDKAKMHIIAGSMREAFGVRDDVRRAGIIEKDGVPKRQYLKELGAIETKKDSEYASERRDKNRKQGPEADTHGVTRAEIARPKHFATAAASLRQAWQDMPEIAELSRSILVEETPEGLDIQLVDQDGRAMFAEGSRWPLEEARLLLARMAPVVRAMPNRIRITGHTSAARRTAEPGLSAFDLSAERAAAVRQVLAQHGVPNARFDSVVGKADNEPLFPNDPYLAANRRVSILLLAEEPPVPPAHRP